MSEESPNWMKRKLTIPQVNAALAKLGEERLRRGRGYYYFYNGEAMNWRETAVYVNSLDALTIDQWVAERNRLAGL